MEVNGVQNSTELHLLSLIINYTFTSQKMTLLKILFAFNGRKSHRF